MDAEELMDRLDELAGELLDGDDLLHGSAALVGLDLRAARQVWVGPDWLAVRADEDRSLQYYGGFEYVSNEARVCLGNYVVYRALEEDGDDRVYRALERARSYE